MARTDDTHALTSSLIMPKKFFMKLLRGISYIYTPVYKNCNKQNAINGYV